MPFLICTSSSFVVVLAVVSVTPMAMSMASVAAFMAAMTALVL